MASIHKPHPSRASLISTIDADFAEYTALLTRFIRAPSPNPPGTTLAAVDVLSAFLTAAHPDLRQQRVAPQGDDKPNLLVSFDGGAGPGPRVILNGHVDTYPARAGSGDDDDDTYSGRDDGTRIHGRGAVDMKAGTAALVVAFALLYERRAELRGSVGLMCVSDEETGGKWGSRWLLEHGADGQSEGASPWRGDVVLNAEPGGLQSVRFGEKGTLRLTFAVRTAGQNGAYTFLSEGAVRRAARLIGELLVIERMRPDLDRGLREYLESEEVKRVADEIMGPGAGENLLVPTVNIGTIRGGLKVNMVPEECVFEGDIRLPIGMEAEQVMQRIHAILEGFPGVTVSIQQAASNPANYCSRDHDMARCLVDSVEEVTGRRPAMITGLGGTDCKFWRYLGVPAYVFGPSPESMGTSHEAVKKDEFKMVIKAHALAVWDCLVAKP